MDLAMDWPQAQVDEGSANSATILPFETDDLSPQNPAQSLTRYQYFFVPSHQKEEDDADCVTKPGAFLRLGSYSDIEEESAQSDNGVAAYYPSRQIASETGDRIYKHAAGPRAAQSCGITMACDGRVLIKSEEKFLSKPPIWWTSIAARRLSSLQIQARSPLRPAINFPSLQTRR